MKSVDSGAPPRPSLTSSPRLRLSQVRPSWDLALFLAFVPGAAWAVAVAIYRPDTIGSQGVLYCQAAAAWLLGQDPWQVGPPDSIFAGPPTMFLPLVPFAFVWTDLLRGMWVLIDLAVAIWTLRRLGLPSYWLIFPPLIQAISLGHPEVVVLGLLVQRGPIGAVAILLKPYAAFAFIAERRWRVLTIAAAVVLLSIPILPWARFFAEYPAIYATLARQTSGDSVFGQPLLMAIALIALASLGARRGLWLVVPVLWPFAQPMYKTITVPMLSPVIAIFWAFPFAGATLVGILVEASLRLINRRFRLPAWVRSGIDVRAAPPFGTIARPVGMRPGAGGAES